MTIPALYELFLREKLITTDSRDIKPGSIFFALKGDKFDGNKFVPEAFEKGASWAVADEDLGYKDTRLIYVDDTLKTLQDLATYHRKKSAFKILAITGSNGKTTTKELCNAVLSLKFKVFATKGNLNNHIGVPLTLLSMDSSYEAGIIEMGANHPGEISFLCNLADPDYGLITNVGKAHLEGFGDIEGVARTKGELFAHLSKNGGLMFVNQGNDYVVGQLSPGYKNIEYYNGSKGVRANHIEANPFLKMDVTGGSIPFSISTNLLGNYNAENILAACAIGIHFGLEPIDIKRAIESYIPQNNRSQLIETAKNKIFMDAYNANPSSMQVSVADFLKRDEANKFLILGEMRELGDSSDNEHIQIIRYLKENNAGHVICIGKAFEKPSFEAGYVHFENVDEMISHLNRKPISGAFIFIKGSRSNQLEKLLPLL